MKTEEVAVIVAAVVTAMESLDKASSTGTGTEVAPTASSAPQPAKRRQKHIGDCERIPADYDGPFAVRMADKDIRTKQPTGEYSYVVPVSLLDDDEAQTISYDGDDYYLVPSIIKNRKTMKYVAILDDEESWSNPYDSLYGVNAGEKVHICRIWESLKNKSHPAPEWVVKILEEDDAFYAARETEVASTETITAEDSDDEDEPPEAASAPSKEDPF